MSNAVDFNQMMQRNNADLNSAEMLQLNMTITQNMIRSSELLQNQSMMRKQLEKSQVVVAVSEIIPAPALPTVGDASMQKDDICIAINGESLDFKNETAEQILGDLVAKFDPNHLWSEKDKATLLDEIKASLGKLPPAPKADVAPTSKPSPMANVG